MVQHKHTHTHTHKDEKREKESKIKDHIHTDMHAQRERGRKGGDERGRETRNDHANSNECNEPSERIWFFAFTHIALFLHSKNLLLSKSTFFNERKKNTHTQHFNIDKKKLNNTKSITDIRFNRFEKHIDHYIRFSYLCIRIGVFYFKCECCIYQQYNTPPEETYMRAFSQRQFIEILRSDRLLLLQLVWFNLFFFDKTQKHKHKPKKEMKEKYTKSTSDLK